MKNTKIRIPGGYVILSCAFEGKHLCGEALGELDELINNLDGNATYAIRSSALNEDGEEASFAGQYETLTDVKKEEIKKAVEQVAASLGNANIIAYTENRIPGADAGPQFGGEAFPERQDNGIGIVIQKFIKAKFAGVLFTADAITGRDDKMVGNYVRGEGEKLPEGVEVPISPFDKKAFLKKRVCEKSL